MKKLIPHGMVAAGSVVLTIALLAAGCGRGGLTRLPVYGTVSRPNGEALNGSVTFLPAEDKSGPAATARVVNGEYTFSEKNGPTAGPHRVIIAKIASREESMETMVGRGAAAGGRSDKREWTLSADVPANSPYRCDFKLED